MPHAVFPMKVKENPRAVKVWRHAESLLQTDAENRLAPCYAHRVEPGVQLLQLEHIYVCEQLK